MCGLWPHTQANRIDCSGVFMSMLQPRIKKRVGAKCIQQETPDMCVNYGFIKNSNIRQVSDGRLVRFVGYSMLIFCFRIYKLIRNMRLVV